MRDQIVLNLTKPNWEFLNLTMTEFDVAFSLLLRNVQGLTDNIPRIWHDSIQIINRRLRVPGLIPIEIPTAKVFQAFSNFPGAKYTWQQDNTYWSFSLADWERVLERDWVNLLEYHAQRFDCENFAGLFQEFISLVYGVNCQAKVLGTTPAGLHGFNLIYTADEGVLFYEPQGFNQWWYREDNIHFNYHPLEISL